jgi:glycosyltransferase involved in cell wall biosynthesis
MKICLIDVFYKSGSTGKIVFDLKKGYEQSNHIVYAFYGRGKKTKEKNVLKISNNFHFYLDVLLTRITGLVGYFSILPTLKLIFQLNKIKPDIVHLHEIHGYYLNTPIFLKYMSKHPNIKFVWTFHSDFNFTGKCGYSYTCNKWVKGCNKCPLVKEYPQSFMFDFTKFMYKDKKKLISNLSNLTIISPSNWLSNRIKRSFFSKFEVYTIHNGINTEVFKIYQTAFNDLSSKYPSLHSNFILSVAPNILSNRKGGNKVIQLATELPNQFFVMIGFKKIPNNLPSNILPIKITENQIELAKFYSAAESFLILSDLENFPTTCIESLCSGTYVIGYDVGGTKETIFPDKFGTFVPFGDIESIKMAITERKYKDISKLDISNSSIKKYNVDVFVKKNLELY